MDTLSLKVRLQARNTGGGNMRYGIWSPTNPCDGVNHVDLYEQQLLEVELAEKLGFDHFWFYEHHVTVSGPIPSPNLMIAAAAMRTKRIRLGNMVNILPYRNPLIVAEEAAMLDTLTNGRLDMGIGRGLKPIEFDAFCVSQAHSREMFHESLAIIRKVWADETFDFHGKYFNVSKKTPLSPPLVQQPHPPFYVSAQSEESIRWAAEHDIPFGQIDALVEDCRRDQAIYKEVQRAAGHAPAPRLFLTREIFVGETDEKARAKALPYLLKYWELWGRYSQFTTDGRMPDDYDSWRKRAPLLAAMSFEQLIESGLVMIGSPETVARQIIRHQQELDIAVLACVFKFGRMPFKDVTESMKMFADHVIPLVAQRFDTPKEATAAAH
jgi:alkanesulfonate monooxygenase SsuD/methylene tetrahydromethanopterin reductase-like flavin-dependent oxidoreductase (luciferase family)